MKKNILSIAGILGFALGNLYSQQPMGEVDITINVLEDEELPNAQKTISFQRRGYLFSDSAPIKIPENKSQLESLINTTLESAISEPGNLSPIYQIIVSIYLNKKKMTSDSKKMFEKIIPYIPELGSESLNESLNLYLESQHNWFDLSEKVAPIKNAIKPIAYISGSGCDEYYIIYKNITDSNSELEILPVGVMLFVKTQVGLLGWLTIVNKDPGIHSIWLALNNEEYDGVKRVVMEQK